MGNKGNHIKLDQQGERYPFYTPEGYFDDLSIKVMARVESHSNPQKKVFIFPLFKPAIRVSVSFLFIMAILFIPAKHIFLGLHNSNQSLSKAWDEEFYISYPLSDHSIFEALESSPTDDTFNNDQLETILLSSVTEYDLIDLNN